MELNEAVLRVLRHGRLIVAVVLVCLAVPLLAAQDQDDTYLASARVSFGPDPANEDEAAAMVDTAEAIVTNPGEVEAVLERRGADRDPAEVEERVVVESVGTSGVLSIAASDTDPQLARALANGLARRFVTARRELVLDPLEERLERVERQLADVNNEILFISGAGGTRPEVIDARRLQLDAAFSRQSGLRAERERLVTTLDATPGPMILAAASMPADPEPSGLFADLLVAGLLGLVLGVAMTAVIEALRPTIVGRRALAGALGAPILGRIPDPFRGTPDLGESDVALRLGLAAESADVGAVHLTTVGPAVDLEPLAEQLRAAAPELAVDQVGSAREPQPGSGGEGLVVVAPEVQPRSGLGDVEQLLALSRWPLVGVITYPCPIWRRHPGPGAVRTLFTRARAALGPMIERRRRSPQHAGDAAGQKVLLQPWLRLRRLVRAPWSETKP